MAVKGMCPFVDANPHLCELVKHKNCHCVIDGSHFAHRLWEASIPGREALSDIPHCAAITRNFFKALLDANIKVHVSFYNPIIGRYHLTHSVHELMLLRMRTLTDIGQSSMDINPWSHFSMHGRIIFGEIIEELGLDSSQDGDSLGCAQQLNAFLISNISQFFFGRCPLGYVSSNWIDLRNPSSCMKTFYIEKFYDAVGANKQRRRYNEKILPMFHQMTRNDVRDVSKNIERFIEKCCLPGRWEHIVNLKKDNYHMLYRKYISILNMLASFTADEAVRFITGAFGPSIKIRSQSGKVVLVREMIREWFNGFLTDGDEEVETETTSSAEESTSKEEGLVFEGWFNPTKPRHRVIASLIGEDSSDSDRTSSSSSESSPSPALSDADPIEEKDAGSSETEENKTADRISPTGDCETEEPGASPGELPQWLLDHAVKEGRYGERGAKLWPLIYIRSNGVFTTPYFLQDPDKLSSSFASLHIRKVLYGIMLHDCHEKDAAVDTYIQEIANRNGLTELFECHVRPTWFLMDTDDPLNRIELPGLKDVTSLELHTRRTIFAITLVGRASWMMELATQLSHSATRDSDFAHSIYRLLVLKAWAMRSSEIRRQDIVALLLSILIVEKRFGLPSGVFPWPVSLENYDELIELALRYQLNFNLNLKLLHPFAQLQSTVVDARYLNVLLNHPYGARVDRIQMFLSEKVFYNLAAAFEFKGPIEAGIFVSGFFNETSWANFTRLLNMILDPHEAQGRQPLIIVPNEILTRLNFDYAIVNEMWSCTEDEHNAAKRVTDHWLRKNFL